jgi:hydrogenase maturation protein HypF
MAERWRIEVEGIVQGVGFRPFVYHAARRLRLAGSVRNDARGVVIEVEGDPRDLDAFVRALESDPPPLAIVERVTRSALPPAGEHAFRILESGPAEDRTVPVSPDVATCPDCLRELFDPADRRHRYPFLNCTNCGPRFTIVRDVPYDRSRTTMAAFPMCPACAREYGNPADRRFHAQPTACPACGPKASLLDGAGRAIACDDPVKEAARRLVAGEIVAVKGLGGWHLACDAANEAAVRRLRAGKQRERKPLALMPPGLHEARRLAELGPAEEALLQSWRRPVVLARARAGAPVAPSVAPGHRDLGLFLPYTPLHHLLLRETDRTLVMTSGNLSDEPIAYKDEEALARLAGMAAAFLAHDREIHMRCDDSVARVVEGQEVLLRRSRGYAPQPVPLPFEALRPILAVGAMLKCAFALVRGRHAFVGHHIGDLENYEAYRAFREGIPHLERLLGIAPAVVAHDLHPDYPSTRYALERAGIERIGVQHHHAHIAAVMAEHGLRGPVIGVACDGTGYGTDGTIWGGEILLADYAGFERAAHLEVVPMPGGEAAVRDAWRMAAAWLRQAFGPGGEAMAPRIAERVGPVRWGGLWRLLASDVPQPRTSSLGRLFDAVSCLLGLCDTADYEGQAAVWLEMEADESEAGAYAFGLGGEAPLVLEATPVVRAIVRDLRDNVAPARIAARFHNGVVEAVVATCRRLRERTGVATVALGGGVMQNALLLGRLLRRLRAEGLEPFAPRRVPPNDGGLCLGQAAVAAALLAKRA